MIKRQKSCLGRTLRHGQRIAPSQRPSERRNTIELSLQPLGIGLANRFDPPDQRIAFSLRSLETDAPGKGQGLLGRIQQLQDMSARLMFGQTLEPRLN